MKILATCRSTRAELSPRVGRLGGAIVPAGFTLLEMLVVLALMATLTGLVLPRLSALFDAGQRNFERRQVLDSLAALPYEAFLRQQAFTLRAVPGQSDPVPLELPAGWLLEAVGEVGINYRSNGFCTGGELRLSRNGAVELLRLTPPLCVPRAR